MKRLHLYALSALALGACASGPRGTPRADYDGYRPYEAQEQQIKQLNDTGRHPLASFALAKAQCWLDVSFHEFTRNDRSSFPREALEQSHRITEELGSSGTSSSALQTPLVNGAARLRPDLWDRLDGLSHAAGLSCGAALVACAQVELVHAGNEYRQIGWRHARPYVQIAEDKTGEAGTAIARCAAPAPAAPTPAAPAAPAATPPAEQIEHMTIEAEALFRFAGGTLADLQPRGRARLDDLVAHLHEGYASIRLIELSGHTDRLGSSTLNLRLSRERADTVRAYLIAHGVSAPIETRGRGADEPVATCAPDLRGAPLRACLEPDRRVEIAVTGVRR
jgi:outer membrane protein OmpA-like peptidoglycan-associated protein